MKPRIPYGMTKRILLAMRFGEKLIVRPEYINAFRVIAKRIGVRFIANSYWTGTGERRVQMMRVAKRERMTGHARQRMPKRDDTGHFLKDAA